MSDPNLPEGVRQSDIDRTVGETFDPDLCEHYAIECENCETNMEACENQMKDAGIGYHRLAQEKDEEISELKLRISHIKEALLNCQHPAGCSGYSMQHNYRASFSLLSCDCAIGESLHQIEMTEK